MSNKTTPPLRGTPPAEGNDSPSPKGWQAKPDGVVPTLRFPEFRDAGEWDEKLLGAVCDMKAGKFVSASEILDKPAKDHYPCFGGNGLRGYTKSFNQSGQYSLIGRQGALCGNVNLVEGNFYATEHAVVTTPKPGNRIDWLFYNLCLLNLNRFATGQAQPGLSIDVLEKVNCAVPKDDKEQQKIADCLSSIDEMLSFESQKLASLKAHKKGLMQQLFPAEGETLPKLRFPEFRDAGEWEVKTLKDIAKISSGGTPSRAEPDYWGGSIPWITTSLIDFNRIDNAEEFITTEGLKNSSAKLFPAQTLLMAMYGQGKTRGKVALLGIEATTNQACAAIMLNKGIDTNFVFQNLASRYDEIRKLSNEGGQENLSAGLIKEISLIYPCLAEQQKIADCLLSIDEQIAAQTQKLAALKTHKKGLMQQLFPSVGGVAGEA
jgi:type I restriction enzyme S subunit